MASQVFNKKKKKRSLAENTEIDASVAAMLHKVWMRRKIVILAVFEYEHGIFFQ